MDEEVFPLKHVPCNQETIQENQNPQVLPGVICEITPFQASPGYKQDSGLAPDSSCLMDIPMHESLIEYRYHLEHNLDTREVSCEMAGPSSHVDYRRGN